jgi:hypothetical protein
VTGSSEKQGGGGAERPEVGSVPEEAAKLFSALQDWATETGGSQAGSAARGLADGLRSVGDHIGHGEDCRYCPLCLAINRVRNTSPEVREHLATAVSELAQAATLALRQSANRPPSDDGPPAPMKVDLDD